MDFSACHPYVNFVFYLVAISLGMCIPHPVFLMGSLLFSLSYFLLSVKDSYGSLGRMFFLFLVIAAGNPLVNSRGDTILFTWWGNRPYTLEAFCYGCSMGAMIVTVLAWFSTYHKIMTEDKFLYCFGKAAPSLTLLLTMILGLVPRLQKKTVQIENARQAIGKGAETSDRYGKIRQGSRILSILTSLALEEGLVTADSMKSRGFGTGKRTSFAFSSMNKVQGSLLIFMMGLVAGILISALGGGMKVSYFPRLIMTGFDNKWMVTGCFCYLLFLSIPTVLQLTERK